MLKALQWPFKWITDRKQTINTNRKDTNKICEAWTGLISQAGGNQAERLRGIKGENTWECVVGWKVAPKKYPHWNPLNLWILPYMVGKDIAAVINIRILRWGDYPGLSGRTLNAITCVLIRGSQREHYQSNMTKEAEIGVMQLQSKECWQRHSRDWKRKGLDSPPRFSKRSMALLTPWFQPWEIDFGLLTYRTVKS